MTFSALSAPLVLALVATGQTPEPSPSPTTEHTIYTVTPGISGFIAFFVFALVGWLLFRSLVKHVRRVDQAKLQQERQAAEEQERQAPEEQDGATDAEPAGRSPDDGPGR